MINFDTPLRQLNATSVYQHFLGDLLCKSPFSSPFRRDSSPSCRLVEWNNEIYYVDFGDKEYRKLDFVQFIEKVFELPRKESIQLAYEEIKLGYDHSNLYTFSKRGIYTGTLDVYKSKEKPNIYVEQREWNKDDELYWKLPIEYLSSHQIYAVKRVIYEYVEDGSITTQLQSNLNHNKYNPTYGYYYGDVNWKIYKPLDIESKWRGNVNKDMIDKDYNEYESYILCSSKKDRLVLLYLLESLNVYNIGTISYQSEVYLPNITYPIIAVIPDNDKTGLEWSSIITTKLRCKEWRLDNYKDIFEYYTNNPNKLTQWLINQI